MMTALELERAALNRRMISPRPQQGEPPLPPEQLQPAALKLYRKYPDVAQRVLADDELTARARPVAMEEADCTVPFEAGARHCPAERPDYVGGLSPLRQKIMHLLTMRDLDQKAIAAQAGLSISALESHLTHIYQHFGVNGRYAAIAEWRRRGLDRLDPRTMTPDELRAAQQEADDETLLAARAALYCEQRKREQGRDIHPLEPQHPFGAPAAVGA